MMIFMHFTFQSIFLAVGFGVGYWLLITANTQEGNLKTIGKVLGGILITMTILFAIFSCYFSTKFANTEYLPLGTQQQTPTMNNQQSQEDTENATLQKHKNSQMNNQNNDEMEDTLPENRDVLLKKDREVNE